MGKILIIINMIFKNYKDKLYYNTKLKAIIIRNINYIIS